MGGLPGFGSKQYNIVFFYIASRPDLKPTQPPIKWVPGALPPRVKWQGHEADHSLPGSAEVKSGGAIPPLPCILSCWRA
jgi:hypothetical protein